HQLLRSIVGLTSPAEEAEILAWRQELAEHDRRYRELADVLAALKGAIPEIRSTPPSPLKLIHRAESPRSPEPTAERGASPRRTRLSAWQRWTLAAGVVLVLAYSAVRFHTSSTPIGRSAIDEYVAGASEAATVMLRDGTVVRLGPQSRLRVSHGPGRRVSLSGRAVFSVAKHLDLPFLIETAGGDVEVLGTRFAVEAQEDDLQVTVIQGRVAVSTRGQRIEVPAGEMRRIVSGATLPGVKFPDVIALGDWVGDFLAFQDTPLPVAAAEISRLYQVRIDIPDSAFAGQTITAWFSDQPLEKVITIFCMVAHADCTIVEGGLITIQPGGHR
ncbi:MAG TPA: FecR domain-containing protein, partial [Longimicrobiaceae bacterium]|nr:FecR domain-containing protein [Longimicrobiaceae bacterium]